MNIPGDKSISHRALMLSAIAEGESCITNLLESEDLAATRRILSSLHSGGVYDCQNSGTTMRLMAGLLCGLNISCTLIGDTSLMKRPMARVVNPLREMGFDISMSETGTAPIVIHASNKKPSTEKKTFKLTVPSAQVKSAILLANLFRDGVTEIIEPVKTRDHTEIMLKQFGADITREDNRIILKGGKKFKATDVQIPGDFSSAAFLIVAATITPGSYVILNNVGVNPTRTGMLSILKGMGADIQLHNQREILGEQVADIEVKAAPLIGINIPHNLIVSAIDEFPIIFIAAACAKGRTILRGASELKVKESDRLKAMSINLNKLGIQTTLLDDGIEIIGGKIQGGIVDSFGDHRIAMAMLVANEVSASPITVNNSEVINTSYPGFPFYVYV